MMPNQEVSKPSVQYWRLIPFTLDVLLFPLLTAGMLVIALLALGLGAVSIPPDEILRIIARKLQFWNPENTASLNDTVIWTVRLPRVLFGICTGAGLAISGAALQGLFRNPLADPGLVGISSGAAVSAVAVLFLLNLWYGIEGFSIQIYALPIAAFAGALLTTGFVYRIGTRNGRTDITMVLLAGIAVNALMGSGIGLMIYASDDQQVRSMMFWMLGSLGGVLWQTLLPALLFLTLPLFFLYRLAKPLNLYLLGESEAGHLGISVQQLKLRVITCVALLVGTSVALGGMIGFIGLVIPHILRLLIGPDHRRLLPASALLGASVLLLADLVSRLILALRNCPSVW